MLGAGLLRRDEVLLDFQLLPGEFLAVHDEVGVVALGGAVLPFKLEAEVERAAGDREIDAGESEKGAMSAGKEAQRNAA